MDVQCCAIIQASYIKRLYMFGALQTYTRWWTLQTYWQARVASTVWRSPPSPLGLAIAAAILASTRPAGPCCCNPCCANSVSLQRAMCAVPTSANCTQCAAIGSSRAQCRVQQQDRGQAGVRSILCVPYIHHRCTPHLPHATQKERIARRDGVLCAA